MLIALDYDGTYTADRALFDEFIASAIRSGHEIIMVTMRFESEDYGVSQMIEKGVSKVIFTGRRAKQPFLAAQEVYPDIWIDDKPSWITNDCLT